jgi:UDP-GlcNAc3NAcA epimerase
VETGWNTLVGCDPERMVRAAFEARPGIESVWPYGDGRAAEKVMETMIKLYKGLTL